MAGLIAFIGVWVTKLLVRDSEKKLINGLTVIFENLHAHELLVNERAEDLEALWKAVQDRTRKTLKKLGVLAFPKLRKADLRNLESVINDKVPAMRAKLHKAIEDAEEPGTNPKPSQAPTETKKPDPAKTA